MDAPRTHRTRFGDHVRVYQEETIGGLGRAWINADAVIDEEGSPAVVEQDARRLRAASLRLRAILAGAAGVGAVCPAASCSTRHD